MNALKQLRIYLVVVPGGRLHVRVPRECLNRGEVSARVEQIADERPPEIVRAEALDARLASPALQDLEDALCVQTPRDASKLGNRNPFEPRIVEWSPNGFKPDCTGSAGMAENHEELSSRKTDDPE